MKRPLALIACAFILSVLSLGAVEKSTFDLPNALPSTSLAKTLSVSGDRMLLSRSAAEASMIDGGYFTLGTVSGISSGTLDDKCTITYGHPFAKTSYPLVHVDGVWAKPEAAFPGQAASLQRTGDSLTLSYTLTGRMTLRFVIRFVDTSGSRIRISASLTNIDAAPHTLGLGMVFDPSLGKGGDCALSLGAVRIVRDTMIQSSSALSSPLTLSERSSALSGLNAALTFPSSIPSSVTIGNWNDCYAGDAPAFTPSDVRTLYDALLKIYWAPVALPAQASITKDVLVTLQEPSFGGGTFCRWDIPSTQSVENGIPFPKTFTSTVTCTNAGGTAKSRIDVELSLPAEIQSTPLARSSALGAQSSVFMAFPLVAKELFETKVVLLRAYCRENGSVTDSLMLPFRICNAPLSDTGLVVTIDSVITSRFPMMGVSFDVQKRYPQQYITSLGADNVFLYENQQRITDFTLGKDTTGGLGSVDIVFVFDVTGSMSASIAGVKNNIMEFADSLARRGVDYRLGMVTFLDAVEAVYDFTTNPVTFKANVASQYAHGGDDTPENSLDALTRATEMTFRPTARRIFIWITDANYHEKDVFTQRTKQEVINRLLSTGVTVHAIGTLGYQTDWYNPIVTATGGTFYNITGNFRDILLDIGSLRGSSRYLFSYRSPFAQSTARTISLSVHYAGYGGSTSANWSVSSRTIENAGPVACFPNPFNPQTTIRLQVPKNARASVVIYSILGQEVKRFTLTGAEGVAQCVWNAKNEWGSDVAAGMYVVRAIVRSSSEEVLSTHVAKLMYVK